MEGAIFVHERGHLGYAKTRHTSDFRNNRACSKIIYLYGTTIALRERCDYLKEVEHIILMHHFFLARHTHIQILTDYDETYVSFRNVT